MQVFSVTGSFCPRLAAYHVPASDRSSSGRTNRAADSKPGQSKSPEARKPRALVVDDARDVTEMIAMFLQHAGYEPVMAFNAKEALDAARTGQFDVIISDIGMPEMNGYELAVALRQLPSYRTVPMIAVTGFSMYDDRGRALQSGFNAHLTKPISPAVLLELIIRLRD
jgi:two-component system, chemotaxis family, CheB/CheR fusion protein